MQLTGKDSQKDIDSIYLSKIDEVHLKVNCEDSIAQELCDYFTFTVPGYTFMPAYRMRIWDGKIRLFNIYNKLLYGGLIQYVFKFAKTLDKRKRDKFIKLGLELAYLDDRILKLVSDVKKRKE